MNFQQYKPLSVNFQDHHRARFLGKIESALHQFVYVTYNMFLCFGFFPENVLGDSLKNWHIFLFQRHISPHIGISYAAYAISN